jgi:hypothetical protein
LFRIADVGSDVRVEVLNLEYLNLKPATFFQDSRCWLWCKGGGAEPETCYLLFRIADVGSGARVEVLNLKPATFYSG